MYFKIFHPFKFYLFVYTTTGPGDFPLTPVPATFGSGVEVMNFSVPITPDMISEYNETFSLQLAEIPSTVTDPNRGTTQQLVEDLVVEPDNASVIITDVNGTCGD